MKLSMLHGITYRSSHHLSSAGSEVISSYSSSSSSSSIMAESVIPELPPSMCLDKPTMDFSYVGIDAILEQMRRKAMKQGFELNIMVVGKLTDLFYTSELRSELKAIFKKVLWD